MKYSVEFIIVFGALTFFGLMWADLGLLVAQKIMVHAAGQKLGRLLAKSHLETAAAMEESARAWLGGHFVHPPSVTIAVEELKLKAAFHDERKEKKARVINMELAQVYTPRFFILFRWVGGKSFSWRAYEKSLQIF